VLGGYALYYLVARSLFDRLERVYRGQAAGSFSNRHAALLSRCMLYAVIWYGVFIYALDLKSLLLPLPLLSENESVQSFAAIFFFFVFLLIAWTAAFPSYRRFFNPQATLRGYVFSHLRFNGSLVAPWLIFSIILDATRLLPPSAAAFLNQEPLADYAFMSCMFILVGAFFPALLVRLWGCRPLAAGPLRERLERFCAKAGFSYADILEWNLFEGKLITAGVLGFVARFRYLLISPALLDLLDAEELEAVVAHEIGHVKHRHMLFYLLFILGYSFCAYVFFSSLFYRLLENNTIFDLVMTDSGRPGHALSFLSMLLLVSLLLVYFRLLFGLFSRNFERQADAFSCRHTGSGRGIIQSLEKIALASSQSRTAPNWHHYSIRERVEFMQRCGSDPQSIRRHTRKVYLLVGAYCAALLLSAAAFAGWGEFGTTESELSVLQKIAERRITAEPDNPLLHFLLGNICFEKKDYGNAVGGYEAALRLTPDNPEILNNLAWLYATAKDEAWRNAPEALRLSRRAAELDPKPHILDTLAESYFQNGDYRSALTVIDMALAQHPPNQSYFEDQRRKFQTSLKKAEEDITPQDFDTGLDADRIRI
jgi:Zn-dependent protease with chaperone function